MLSLASWLVVVTLLLATASAFSDGEALGQVGEDGVMRVRLLPPGPDNPRNSEGDFVQLEGGRILFVYSHFTAGSGDHDSAHLAGRYSGDGGATWTEEDVVILPNEARMNIMSVSLLRVDSGEIALLYMRKNSLSDCCPCIRFSTDEARTWSNPIEIIGNDEVAYYVVNNDRVIQLRSGRIVVPAALHRGSDGAFTPHGRALCYLSDDSGRTWRRSKTVIEAKSLASTRAGLQEPGVVEMKDGRLMMFCRTTAGCQYVSHSTDEGETWSSPRPSNIISPCSPASVERIPSTGDLLLVWNNHDRVAKELRGKRTPFNAAISRDEGKTWSNVKTLEDNPHGWYCYTAVEFVGDCVLFGHCAGDRRHTNGLAQTQITRFPVDWLYR